MPLAREVFCKVLEVRQLTPSVLGIRFEPSKSFAFEPGQFLSIIVPKPFAPPQSPKRLRRIYSFAAPREQGYELCIKITGGPGSQYLLSLKEGSVFAASAPYGDFIYEPREQRRVCFVSTGTGIAPFRAMVLSRIFADQRPEKAVSIFGAHNEREILYREDFEQAGVETVIALSKPTPEWKGFKGRVTDYLNLLPPDWDWQATDFYLCGNGKMVSDVKRILLNSRGVPMHSIHEEVYFGGPAARCDDREAA